MIIINSALVKCKVIALIQFVLACMILPLFSLALLGFFLEPEPDMVDVLIICVLFDALGAWLLYCAIRRVKGWKALERYSAFLSMGSPGVRIAKLASVVGEKDETMKKNFQWMIKKGFFKDAFIDDETGCVIFHDAYWRAMDKARAEEEEKKASLVSVVCVCCGGTTTVVRGQGGVCDYCGAPLDV